MPINQPLENRGKKKVSQKNGILSSLIISFKKYPTISRDTIKSKVLEKKSVPNNVSSVRLREKRTIRAAGRVAFPAGILKSEAPKVAA
jgi:hypothetical protein